jgi:hypothetical protein
MQYNTTPVRRRELAPYVECYYQVSGTEKESKPIPPQPGSLLAFDFNENCRYNGYINQVGVMCFREQSYL